MTMAACRKRKKRKKKKNDDGPKVVDPDHMRRWLTRACRESNERPSQFFIMRDRSGAKKVNPIYRVYVDDGVNGRNEFVMMGRQRSYAGKSYGRGANYLITMDSDEIDRSSNLILSKLRSNATGSEYYIYDHGMKPEAVSSEESVRKELGLVFFSYAKMGPGKISFVVPTPTYEWKAMNDSEKIGNQWKNGNTKNLISGSNKRPKWDEQAGGHVLNFHGRVTQSSIKNFQLVSEATGDKTVLQFGRVDKHKFTMDVAYPLSPVQGFAICLATLDGKWADTSVFGALKSFGSRKKNANKSDDEDQGDDEDDSGEKTQQEEIVETKLFEEEEGWRRPERHGET